MHYPLDPTMQQLFLMFGDDGVERFFTNHPASDLMAELQKMSKKEATAAINAMHWIQGIVIGEVVVSIGLTVLLATFFCLNIRNRLLIMVNNTKNLASGLPLSAPIAGNDEIAELDRFLFKSASEIRELERFKREMIGVASHELKSPLSSISREGSQAIIARFG